MSTSLIDSFSALFRGEPWNLDPTIVEFGPVEIRYYGLFFAIGLLLGARALPVYFERWGFPRKHGESLTLWMPVAMIIGAHLVHLIFYEPHSFIDNPRRIIEIGSGLASHGGGLGAFLAVFFFARRNGVPWLKYMDAATIGAAWVIPWVRVGNFFNSEIVGRPWDGPWAVTFLRHDCRGYQDFICDAPSRHPSQVYEALIAFALLAFAVYLQRNWRNRLRPGAMLFSVMGLYFTSRFFVEYVKAYQANAESSLFTMGQMLSLPIVAVCASMLLFSKTSNIRSTISESTDPPEPAERPSDSKEDSSSEESDSDAAAPSSKQASANKQSTRSAKSAGRGKKARRPKKKVKRK